VTWNWWFNQIVIFQTDYDEIELQKNNYNVIVVTSTKNVTRFFHFGPLSIEILKWLLTDQFKQLHIGIKLFPHFSRMWCISLSTEVATLLAAKGEKFIIMAFFGTNLQLYLVVLLDQESTALENGYAEETTTSLNHSSKMETSNSVMGAGDHPTSPIPAPSRLSNHEQGDGESRSRISSQEKVLYLLYAISDVLN